MSKIEKNYTDEDVRKTVIRLLNYFKSMYEVQEKPKAILLGGQPGAGKSALENMINIKDEYISISGDDYRKYHPLYDQLNNIYGRDSSKYTQQWAGEITSHLITQLRAEKYNLIIEGTLRTAELPLKEARNLKNNGYSVELYVIAVKPEKSYLGTLLRYEKMIENGQTPRMTPKEHHDLVVNNIAQNLETIYKAKIFDNIKIYTRDNELLYNCKENSNINPKNIIEGEFNRKWKTEEILKYKESWQTLFEMLEKRKALTTEIEELKENMNVIVKKIEQNKENIAKRIKIPKKELNKENEQER